MLQGYGVTVDLVGSTLISGGSPRTTFKTRPTCPFSDFELNLPEGHYSALAANANLCARTVTEHKKLKGKKRTIKKTLPLSLSMPTVFTAQNGATLSQSTKIAVSGCPKVKAARTSKASKKRRQ